MKSQVTWFKMHLSVMTVISGALLMHLTTGSNLLLDPSFESPVSEADIGAPSLLAWKLTIRRSLWETDHSLTVPIACDGEIRGRTGRCALRLEPPVVREHLVFVSQFVAAQPSSPLLISFWSRSVELDDSSSRNVDQSAFYLRVDIDYVNAGSRLTVRVKPRQHAQQRPTDFVRNCVIVPNYGQVRTLLVHFVVEDNRRRSTDLLPTNTLYADDVSVNTLETNEQVEKSLNDGCAPYVDSFPRTRHVVADFLSPITHQGVRSITLATQLTVDRLAALERTASMWQGHVSAALLVYDDVAVSTLRDVTRTYYLSKALRSHVTIHLVREHLVRHSLGSIDDNGDDDDWTRYPVNFLRNIALAHVSTSHVLYLDADLMIVFTERDLWRWLHDATIHVESTSSVTVEKTAFLIPVFIPQDPTKELSSLPRTKDELLRTGRGFQPLPYTSHSVIKFGQWKAAETAYRVNYIEDMEPYFVVPSTAPVTNDVFAGYGRDKCAYSRDLKESGFDFFVLPEAYLIYTQDKVETPTIYERAAGVRPEMFFNTESHRRDIEVGHRRFPAEYNARSSVSSSSSVRRDDDLSSCPQRTEDASCLRGDQSAAIYTSEHLDDEELETFIREDSATEENQEVNDHCASKTEVFEKPSEIREGRYRMVDLDERIDILVEMLMTTYGATTYVELSTSSTVEGLLNVMLPLMQPEAAIVVQLSSSCQCDHVTRGLFETYRTNCDDLNSTLQRVIVDHPGPKLYVTDASMFAVSLFAKYMGVLLSTVTVDDVIVILQYAEDAEIRDVICRSLPPRWKLHWLSSRHVLIKLETLSESRPAAVPPLPFCPTEALLLPDVHRNVDVLLFTKNRPLQTLAFLESLSRMASGVGTVWVIFASQSSLVDAGYDLVGRCFKQAPFRVEFIADTELLARDQLDIVDNISTQTFGKTLIDTLRVRSKADHVMLAVDEMIWLRPVDLLRATRPLARCSSGNNADEFFSVQLRLGKNLELFDNLPDRTKRFQTIVEESAFSAEEQMFAFYPRQWPYDFGYVLNTDGVVARRRDLLADFNDHEDAWIAECRGPGCLETTWNYQSLRRRSRQWQVMCSTRSAVVNNEIPGSERVDGGTSGLGDKTVELVKLLVIERKKIDIEGFIKDYGDAVRTPHVSFPVDYVELGSDC